MNALILMTRIPIAGKTKTRLMKTLSGEECAELHKCFLKDIFKSLENIKNDMDIYVTYTPEGSFNILDDITPSYISNYPQVGDTLGLRMLNSIDKLLCEGYKNVVLIGSDIPQLKAEDIKRAFELLDSNDVVLGPTFDGGYYLIGMKKIHSQLFSDSLKWGYKSVFEGTVDIANKSNLKVGLAAKYRDIDTEEDLLNLIERFDNKILFSNEVPCNTIMFINKLWSDFKNAKRHLGR
jgi:uncharacterized protein